MQSPLPLSTTHSNEKLFDSQCRADILPTSEATRRHIGQEMAHSDIHHCIRKLGSVATVAAALVTQPLLANSSDVIRPVLQAALASIATRSDKKSAVPTQLVLQPAETSPFQLIGHRS